MKLQHCVSSAILAAFSCAPAIAAPMIQFANDTGSSVTLQVVTDANGSLGAELAVTVETTPGLTITGASVDFSNFDDSNPGANPFTNSVTFGLYEDLAAGQVFASFGAGPLGIGAFDFLTLDYTGAGDLMASGIVAQGGLLGEVLTADVTVGGSTGPMLPEIQFVDNMDGTVTLQVVVSEFGSTASELAFSVNAGGSLSIDGATLANPAIFNTANPGLNPFTGGVTNGLFTDLPVNEVFASFGSVVLPAGTFDFLTLDVSGAGTLNASGLVAQLGELNDDLSASINLVPEPTTAFLALIGLAGVAVRRRVA